MNIFCGVAYFAWIVGGFWICCRILKWYGLTDSKGRYRDVIDIIPVGFLVVAIYIVSIAGLGEFFNYMVHP